MEWFSSRRGRWFDAPCHLCRRDTVDPTGLCVDCLAEWHALLGRPRCISCGLTLPDPDEGMTCGACSARPWPFDGVVSAVDLVPSVRELVHRLKYRQDFSVLPLLQETLTAALGGFPDIMPLPEVLVPMPLHPAQRRRRGFNQAWLLAAGLGRAIDRPVHKRGVRRVRDTGSLTTQSARERRRALKGAFAVAGDMPRRVAIVDDVLTTGASARALATELRRGGAESVIVWSLARTP
ncbi:ComF family protein [Guyparkeria hydrothermalis]|uniref:ComF family protein n=1 Tax=Guyparkeria hydrothermalis TaxID=923 RepID=UPI0020218F22|nr:ComF family protein [Guyparkeria hydrothermalis]MCL7745193.1 ComF family protein [Guyparkeria hydrothermalis]